MSHSSSTNPSGHSTHSDPIPIQSSHSHRTRSRSASETSEDSVPPLSPSQSPASATSDNVQTPFSSTSRIPLSPVAPSSPILSYFYGSPAKSPFNRTAFSNTTFEDEEPQDPPPTSTGAHGRRMSSSWIPGRFAPQTQQQQNTPATESQQDRGAGVLRRLSISNTLTSKPPVSGRSTTPPRQDGGTRPGSKASPRASGQLRKAATLSAGTVDANSKPRAPSPMGERMLKGHYDGF
ncbi:hypothetical protein JB92DRAFT_2828420 [Gautieria morchelliformis]|nr:hypothetical protein JB92DRAFT_2828420 [Gautieria morchelliformis]